jgi:putative chitinase
MNALAVKLLNYAKSAGFSNITCAMLLAQCHHESQGFTKLEENLNYSTIERILSVFKTRINSLQLSSDIIKKCVNNPRFLANTMYSNRMGNGPCITGDGYKYRGRGLIQLTGKNNYELYNRLIPTSNLLVQPERASLPDVAIQIAVQYFIQNKIINNSNVEQVTKVINGGVNGLEERTKLYDEYRMYLWVNKI